MASPDMTTIRRIRRIRSSGSEVRSTSSWRLAALAIFRAGLVGWLGILGCTDPYSGPLDPIDAGGINSGNGGAASGGTPTVAASGGGAGGNAAGAGGGNGGEAGRRDAAAEVNGPASDLANGGEFELRITANGRGSAIIADHDSYKRLWCDSECVTGPDPKKCPDCVFRYPAGTRVALEFKPRAPSIVTSWSGACAGAKDCSVLMDKDQVVGATIEIDGATKLEAVTRFERRFTQLVTIGNDVFAAGTGSTGFTTPGGQTLVRPSGFLSRLNAGGIWSDVQLFGETWQPATWTLYGLVATDSGGLLGIGEGSQQWVAFRGAPNNEFSVIGLPANIDSVRVMRDGFLVNEVPENPDGMPSRSLRLDANGTKLTTLPIGGFAASGDRGSMFMQVYSEPFPGASIVKINAAGQTIWTVDSPRNVSFQAGFDGGDGLLLWGDVSAPVVVGGMTVRSPVTGSYVIALSGSNGAVKWSRVVGGARHPHVAVSGTSIYFGASMLAPQPPIQLDDSVAVAGTGFVCRLDPTSGKVLWSTPIAHDVVDVLPTPATILVAAENRLYRFLP
jgi:hypothetical protein